jgi:hypothetical protein
MSTAGPEGWNPPPVDVGLPNGPAILFPFLSYTRMSGVNLLAGSNVPTVCAASLLQTLGKPCPDSSTEVDPF